MKMFKKTVTTSTYVWYYKTLQLAFIDYSIRHLSTTLMQLQITTIYESRFNTVQIILSEVRTHRNDC